MGWASPEGGMWVESLVPPPAAKAAATRLREPAQAVAYGRMA
jgi:hypothetical protein